MSVARQATAGAGGNRIRGSDGRFKPLRQRAKAAAAANGAESAVKLRPPQCMKHLREQLASSFPAIVQGFVKQAESGSVPHLKLTTELLKEAAPRKKAKGTAQRLLEEIERAERADTVGPACGMESVEE